MSDLKNDLGRWADAFGPGPTDLEGLGAARDRRRKRHRAGIVVTSLVLLAVAGSLVWRGFGDGAGPIPAQQPATPPDLPFLFEKQLGERGGIGMLERPDADPIDIVEHGVQPSAMSVSPDGTRIAYTGIGDDGDEHLFVAGTRGEDPRVIYTSTGPTFAIAQTAWSPDGGTIGFTEYGAGPEGDTAEKHPGVRVWAIDAGGATAPRAITPFGMRASTFDWSPDGASLVVAFEDGGSSDLWIQPVDGTQPTQLTTTTYSEWNPAWSPDGDTIAFTALDEGYTAPVMGLDMASGRTWPITKHADRRDWSPTWSPDGEWLIFERVDDETCGSWTVEAIAEGEAPQEGQALMNMEHPDTGYGTWCPANNRWVPGATPPG